MRVQEFITELKSIKLDTGEMPLVVWMNPTNSELKQLLKRFEIRALIWKNGRFIAWDAHRAIHFMMSDTLIANDIIEPGDEHTSISIILSNTNEFSTFEEWEEKETIESNGIWYLTDINVPKQMVAFAKRFP